MSIVSFVFSAVVALLKKLGASSKLTYVVVGEALLNDGTALVLYNLLFQVFVKDAKPLQPLYVFVYFLRVIVVSPLLGAAIGAASLFLLQLATRESSEDDNIMQVIITVCCAYSSFFIGERVMEVSGVITCCSAGAMLATFAPTLILRHENMSSFWGTIEFIGNTLIFVLAGLIIGSKTLLYVATLQDFLYIPMVYVFLVLVRAAMMAFFYPFLNWRWCLHHLRTIVGDNPTFSSLCGDVIDEQQKEAVTIIEAAFGVWGGLRGAVSMTLALSLDISSARGETMVSKQHSHRVFFFLSVVLLHSRSLSMLPLAAQL